MWISNDSLWADSLSEQFAGHLIQSCIIFEDGHFTLLVGLG